MPLFKVTYPSGPYAVKGYLAWPDDFCINEAVLAAVWRIAVATTVMGGNRELEQMYGPASVTLRGRLTGSALESAVALERLPGTLDVWAGELWEPAEACAPTGPVAVHPAVDGSPHLADAVPSAAAFADRGSPLPAKAQLTCTALPAVVFCRGGIGRVGAVRKHWVAHMAASQGCVVFAPCYRGNEGGEGRDEFGGADVEDVRMAVRILHSLPFVDPRRVFVLGFSRGAINAMRAAREEPGIRAVAVWGGVSDLAATYEERVDLRRMLRRVIGGTPRRVPEAYRLRSPAEWVEEVRCPIVIVHGTADVQVDISHALRLTERLRAAGRSPILHLYEGYGHHLPPLIHDAVVTRLFEALCSLSNS